jgi:hypothetical protein
VLASGDRIGDHRGKCYVEILSRPLNSLDRVTNLPQLERTEIARGCSGVLLIQRTGINMVRRLVRLIASFCFLGSGLALADDAARQIAGTWKLVSWLTKFDGGDIVEPYGPNAKGRLVLTPEGQWIIILTGADRKPAKTNDEKAALLDSVLAYSGKYTIEGNRIITRVDMSSNEIYTGPNQMQTRFFTVEGNKLILRTPEIVSAVRAGQKAVGTITFEREH